MNRWAAIATLIVLSAVWLEPTMLNAQQGQCDISGTWMNDGNTREVTISARGDVWTGKLSWSSEQNGKIGFAIFQGFHYDDQHGDYSGTVVRPDSGGRALATLSCQGSTTIKLTAHKGPLRKSSMWHRVASQ